MSHFFVHAPFSVEEWTRDRRGHAKDDDEERSELGEGQFGTTVRMKARTKIEGADVEAGKLFAVKTFMLKKIRKYKEQLFPYFPYLPFPPHPVGEGCPPPSVGEAGRCCAPPCPP